MLRFATSYANALDHGASYEGPIIMADSLAAAEAIVLACVRGPNGELVSVSGEIVSGEVDVADGLTTYYTRVREHEPETKES